MQFMMELVEVFSVTFVGVTKWDEVGLDANESYTEDEDNVEHELLSFSGGKSQLISTMSTRKVWKT